MTEYALITGASSGIGLEFARIAAFNRINLILLSRNSEKLIRLQKELEEQYSIKVLAVGCDLTEHDAVEKIAALLSTRDIVPNILINSAEFGIYGPFSQLGVDSEANMIQLNVVSMTELTKVIYRQMCKRGSGRILNISSVAGFMPGPLMAAYHASKAYVLSFSEALAAEAKGSGVSVTVLCPGPKRKFPTARKVAKYGWKSMMKGKTIAVHGRKYRWLLFLIRFLPRKTVVKIAYKMQKS